MNTEPKKVKSPEEWAHPFIYNQLNGIEIVREISRIQNEAYEAGYDDARRHFKQTQPTATKGQVVKTREGRKYVVNKPHELPIGAQVIADTPHGDGDFSYCCGIDWCRCMQ